MIYGLEFEYGKKGGGVNSRLRDIQQSGDDAVRWGVIWHTVQGWGRNFFRF